MADPRDRKQPAKHDPWDIGIEQTIIGSMMRDPRLIDTASADLESSHFYDPLNGRIFDMLVALNAEDGGVTPLILHSVMKADPGIIETGGLNYLEAMWAASPSTPQMREWVRILLDLAMRRELLRISGDLTDAALSPPGEMTAQQASELATESLLQAGRVSAKPIRSIREIAAESIREAEDLRHGKPIPMVKTGFNKLDRELGGLRGGDFAVLLGKSRMGKTALMVGISRYTAQHGIPTFVASPEMTSRQWIDRMVCDIDFDTAEKPMWYSRIRNGRLSDDEFARYVLASQRTEGWPFEIHDDDDITMAQLSARARAFAAKHKGKLGIVLIDYLQIIQPADERENRERQVARIARAAKSLAKRLGWPVVAGSQMNEGDTQRSKEEKRPQPSDARESRGIMNEADQMLAPWRPAVFVENRKPMDAMPDDLSWTAWAAEMQAVKHRFDLLCLKNRHGRTFDLELYCEMGANAIRDEAPRRSLSPQEAAAADLLDSL